MPFDDRLTLSDWLLAKRYHQSAMFYWMGAALTPWRKHSRRDLARKLAEEYTPDELWRVRLCDQDMANRERREAYEHHSGKRNAA